MDTDRLLDVAKVARVDDDYADGKAIGGAQVKARGLGQGGAGLDGLKNRPGTPSPRSGRPCLWCNPWKKSRGFNAGARDALYLLAVAVGTLLTIIAYLSYAEIRRPAEIEGQIDQYEFLSEL